MRGRGTNVCYGNHAALSSAFLLSLIVSTWSMSSTCGGSWAFSPCDWPRLSIYDGDQWANYDFDSWREVRRASTITKGPPHTDRIRSGDFGNSRYLGGAAAVSTMIACEASGAAESPAHLLPVMETSAVLPASGARRASWPRHTRAHLPAAVLAGEELCVPCRLQCVRKGGPPRRRKRHQAKSRRRCESAQSAIPDQARQSKYAR